MKLSKLSLLNFRNIQKEEIVFSKNINVFYGGNGQGKTSVLESIYLLGITKSFRVNDDKAVLKQGSEYFDITGHFKKDKGKEFSVRVFFSGTKGKHVFYNQKKVKSFSSIVGVVPIILLSLEDLTLTYGSPAARRKFIDILISQIDAQYLQALKKFKEVLQQRNKILSLISEKEAQISDLIPWDVQFSKFAAYILFKRKKILDHLNDLINALYKTMSGTKDEIGIKYNTFVNIDIQQDTIEQVETRINQKLNETQRKDIYYGSTTSGPHRDDIIFFKNNQPLKTFGSQGENKTFLISLKFAEAQLIEKELKERPLLLLDDIFSELDESRIENVIKSIIDENCQTFITSTTAENFKKSNLADLDFFKLNNGTVVHET